MFSVKFDKSNVNWKNDAELNLMFLKNIQRLCNDEFRRKGYLLLNEVFSKLGCPETEDGDKYGWWYDEEIPFGINFIDFGLYDITRKSARNFINGYTTDTVLYFNTYGDVASILFDQLHSREEIDDMFNHPWNSYMYY